MHVLLGQIFESQTGNAFHTYQFSIKLLLISAAALRHALGDEHVFEFVEGSVPFPPAPGTSERWIAMVDNKLFPATD